MRLLATSIRLPKGNLWWLRGKKSSCRHFYNGLRLRLDDRPKYSLKEESVAQVFTLSYAESRNCIRDVRCSSQEMQQLPWFPDAT
jgi:hypothetical protein